MKIEKEIKSKIERDYFFVEGSLENIDSDYFINKIEQSKRTDYKGIRKKMERAKRRRERVKYPIIPVGFEYKKW